MLWPTTAPRVRTSAFIPIPRDGDEGSAIQFGMVCDVEAGVMWLAPGQPCSTPFQELTLVDLLG